MTAAVWSRPRSSPFLLRVSRTMKPRLPARVFYGVIVAGVLLGVTVFPFGGWLYLERGGDPTGRRIWEADAGAFVIPICAMMGATFGGLAGFAVAVVLERRNRSSV